MHIVRYLWQEYEGYGIVDGHDILAVEGDVFGQFSRGGQVASLDEVKILPPCRPSKIVAVGLNYRAHAAEAGATVPDEPLLFFKPPSAVIGHRDEIVYPSISERVDHEAELAVVIGQPAHFVTEADASDYVLGYTCANDVTARDLQHRDNQWARAKGCDTFCPLGPFIATELDPGNVRIQSRVNGETRQDSNTADMVFSIPELISFITQAFTLEPGDVILTGTPSGIGPLQPGDVVEVEIEGIGVLRNSVVAEVR